MCWATNTALSWVFDAPPNVESSYITALILALIVDPARSPSDLTFLGWAAIAAMASKYILAIRGRHIFNPAAIAVVVVGIALGEYASWWVGTTSMLPFMGAGGILVVRKVRQEVMVGTFLLAALVTVCVVSVVQGVSIARELQQLVVESPLFFFAAIMLTEPLTAPPTMKLKQIYGLITGVLVIPQIHVGSLYSTPELALVVGNAFSFLLIPRQRVTLKVSKKNKVSSSIVDFVFRPSQRLAYVPGQYIECTLAHPHPDSRGNRRYFTLASSPTEENVRLGVRFYEQGSSFKRAMRALDGRTQLIGTQVAGDFTLPPDQTRKLVFIAGGIGITPYRSMLKYLLDTKQRRDIVMLYANRAAKDIVYKDVLSEAQAKLGIKVVYTLTDTAAVPRDWAGSRGRVDTRMIQELVPDFRERTYYLSYLSGSPEMVRSFERLLKEMQIPRGQIKKDFFLGLV
jgi:ferredoxin-NADP reductase